MIGADYIVATRNPSTGATTIKDYFSDSKRPCTGSSSGVMGTCPVEVASGRTATTLVSAENVNNQYTFEFTRPRVVGDAWHVSFTNTNITNIFMLSAFGEYDGEEYIGKHLTPSPYTTDTAVLATNPGLSACVPPTTTVPTPAPSLLFNIKSYNFTYAIRDFITVGWNLTGNNTVSFGVQMSSRGWIGFGFSKDNSGSMVPGEAFISNNGESAGRYNLNNYDGAVLQSGLPDADFLTVNGVSQYRFRRSLSDILTSGTADPTKLITIYAFSTSNTVVSRHSESDSGSLQINLLTGEIVSIDDKKLIKAHGWLMWIGWGVLVPLAAAIARFMKKTIGVWWFRLHIILMLLALAVIIAGFGIIVNESREHFETSHARLGLATFILAMIQPIVGFIADRMFDPNRDKTPFFPDILHWIFGWSALVMALVNIWLGIDLYDSPQVIWILWGIHFALMTLILIVWAVVNQVSSAH
eukprot:TRINITY_DN1576_c0_g1_i1.p1 TRINITY_DN1576_c0_g1~~TRINITY_DN1576_c0_g1_i1.p1  ORF type:complete len:469 (+),score=121.17 TRINITY_DN1576_c0_g1_i1:359-1765(+)